MQQCLNMLPCAPQVRHAPGKGFGARQISALCPAAPPVHTPHRRSWWRRGFRLIPSSSGVTNPTSPHMLLRLISERLLVAVTSTPAQPRLLLQGTTILPPQFLTLQPKQLTLPRHHNGPAAAPAGATSCLRVRCCRTQTRCLRGASRCLKSREEL